MTTPAELVCLECGALIGSERDASVSVEVSIDGRYDMDVGLQSPPHWLHPDHSCYTNRASAEADLARAIHDYAEQAKAQGNLGYFTIYRRFERHYVRPCPSCKALDPAGLGARLLSSDLRREDMPDADRQWIGEAGKRTRQRLANDRKALQAQGFTTPCVACGTLNEPGSPFCRMCAARMRTS